MDFAEEQISGKLEGVVFGYKIFISPTINRFKLNHRRHIICVDFDSFHKRIILNCLSHILKY